MRESGHTIGRRSIRIDGRWRMVIALLFGGGVIGLSVGLVSHPRELLMTSTKLGRTDRREYYQLTPTSMLVVVNESVDTANITYHDPSLWRFRFERLDLNTHSSAPVPGLTRMFEKLRAYPDQCLPSPNGNWIIWTVSQDETHLARRYLVSTSNGTLYHLVEPLKTKEDEPLWLSSGDWIEREDAWGAPGNRLRLHRIGPPPSVRDMPLESTEAARLIAGQTGFQDPFEYKAFDQTEVTDYGRAWIEKYSVRPGPGMPDSSLPDVYTVPMPPGRRLLDTEISPDRRRLLFTTWRPDSRSLQARLHHFLPGIPEPAWSDIELWTSDIRGNGLYEVGRIPLAGQSDPIFRNEDWDPGARWLPDSRHIEFKHDQTLYMTTMDP